MKNSYNIWIPSIQNFLRFKELDYDQYRCLMKVIEDKEIELLYLLNEIIRENLIDSFDIKKITTLDRFIIFLSLKIHSCGPTISLTKKCSNCSTSTGIKMDLNQLIENIAPKVDRIFTHKIQYNGFVAVCDIPSIETEYQIYHYSNIFNIDENSQDFTLNNYIISHINELIINGTPISFNTLTYPERIGILSKLPAGLTHRVHNDFLKEIHDSLTDIDFLKINCQKCKDSFEMKFDISNINDILKIVYRDNNLEGVLQTIMNISAISKGMSECMFRMSPSEIDILHNLAQKTHKASETPPPQQEPMSKDLFEEYRQERAGMEESPSEFSGL